MLGLRETAATEDEGRTYECGGGTSLEVFRTRAGVGAGHTECGWEVDDIEAVVADLRNAGVTFDEVDLGGGVSAVDGTLTMAGKRGALFRDPDGNVLAVFQRSLATR